MLNTVLTIASIVGFVIALIVVYYISKSRTEFIPEEEYNTMEELLEAVKHEMVELVKEDYSLGLSEAEFNMLYRRKARINDALKNCVYGIDSAKIIVIELIRSFIANNVPHHRVTDLLGLSDGLVPSDHVIFEILLYKYKRMLDENNQQLGKKALEAIITKYNLDRERYDENGNLQNYYFSREELISIYTQEDFKLTMDEQIELLAILVYQQYAGFGILDTLREMDINGFNIGTSGSIMTNLNAYNAGTFKAADSVWVYYKGKYIHFRFMSFGSEDEVRRVVQLIARYNNPGALTAKRGYLVNTMYDKSRVLALRPPASEYWAVFVRKFTISDPTPEKLIIKDYTVNGELVINLIKFLIKGKMTCGVTGRQGSGKTTLMSSIIRYIDPRLTIRVLEMAPELYLREIYPNRNILSVQETTHVTATELQDALKKSDAAVSLVGEVATDEVAARMIQMGMTASMFTIFSHHANTAEKLVYTLRNSLVNAGGFTMDTATAQILEVVNFDIHLDYNAEGQRYIERITEIIPLLEIQPLPEIDPNNVAYSQAVMQREYYTRRTAAVTFITQDILRYDTKTKTYYAVERISPRLEKIIRDNLGHEVEEFDKFMLANWGRRKPLADGQVVEDPVALSVLDHYRLKAAKEQNTDSPILQGLSATAQQADMAEMLTDDMIEYLRQEIVADEEHKKRLASNDTSDELTPGLPNDIDEDHVVMLDFFTGGVET